MKPAANETSSPVTGKVAVLIANIAPERIMKGKVHTIVYNTRVPAFAVATSPVIHYRTLFMAHNGEPHSRAYIAVTISQWV